MVASTVSALSIQNARLPVLVPRRAARAGTDPAPVLTETSSWCLHARRPTWRRATRSRPGSSGTPATSRGVGGPAAQARALAAGAGAGAVRAAQPGRASPVPHRVGRHPSQIGEVHPRRGDGAAAALPGRRARRRGLQRRRGSRAGRDRVRDRQGHGRGQPGDVEDRQGVPAGDRGAPDGVHLQGAQRRGVLQARAEPQRSGDRRAARAT